MLLTEDNDELQGVSQLLGHGSHVWRSVHLNPKLPYFLVNLFTKEDDFKQINTIFFGGEFDVAVFCVEARTNTQLRIEDIIQLSRQIVNGRECWELSKVVELWEGKIDGEYTTVVVIGENGKPLGSDPYPEKPVKMTAKVYPT